MLALIVEVIFLETCNFEVCFVLGSSFGHFVLDVIIMMPISNAGMLFSNSDSCIGTQFVFMSMDTTYMTMWSFVIIEMVENLESIPGVMGHGLVMDVA